MKTGESKRSDPNKTLYIYTRVSTTVQADEGMSLDIQAEIGKERATKLGFTPKVLNEGGVSSNHEGIDKRKVLSEVYSKILSGDIKHLFVYDQSRLSRNDDVSSAFRIACNRNGVTLYTKDGQYDLSNSSDQFMKKIMDAVAELDNAQRAERTRLGKLARARGGNWHGGPPPFGYSIVDKKLIVNKNESVWVKRIFTDTLKGKSTLDIKKLLDSKGVLTRRRVGTWTLGSIQSLIKNTHYKGYYTYTDKRSEESVTVLCPAIVDETTWTSVQKLKTRVTSRVSQQNRTKNFYLLRDLMVCGHCGLAMSARSKISKNENHYYCPHKERKWVVEGGSKTPWERGHGCGMERSLNIPETDQLVWDTVLDIHRKSSVLKEEVKWKILEEYGVPAKHSEAELKVLERQLKQLEKQLKVTKEGQAELVVNHSTGQIKPDVYELALKRSAEYLHDLEVKIANLQLQLKGGDDNRKWFDWLKVFGQRLDEKNDLTNEEKKQYLTGLIKSITVKYDRAKNQHDLQIKFQLPIVGDGIVWNDPKKKGLGYTLKRGKRSKMVVFKKKAGRGVKLITPLRNQSVTVE